MGRAYHPLHTEVREAMKQRVTQGARRSSRPSEPANPAADS